MTPDQIQLAVEKAIGQNAMFPWLHYIILLVVVAAGTYLGLKSRAKPTEEGRGGSRQY